MRKILKASLLFCILLSITSNTTLGIDSPRLIVDLTAGWKFMRKEMPQAEQFTTDDSAWDAITLPHTWNNLDGQDGGNNYYRGTGWYRLHLKYEPAWNNRQIYIKFDAASINTTVYVNGKEAGRHAGSFGAFCFDLTSLLNKTGDNLIAVKVNNAHDENVAPLAGDFTVFGGIYRGVHLIVTDSLSISTIDDASSGVYIRQDKVSADEASLHVTTMLNYPYDVTKTSHRIVKCELLDTAERAVATESTNVAILGGSQAVEVDLKVRQPHLWSGRKDPHLYTLRVSLLDGIKLSDVVEQHVGLRFFRVDPDKGFFLNGEPYRLVGVNRHQDHLDKGWAIGLEDHQNDFANMMEMGCTGVRLSHYQHAQEFYDLCDRGGMVAWAEIPMINRVNNSPEFDANASQQLRELIKQNFNHPSICFWSLSNELGNNGLKGEELARQQEHQVELMTKLNDEAHKLDATRLTTEASMIQPGKPQDAITDVLAFNRYYGWYNGKPAGLGSDLDKIHAAYPKRGAGISEFGAGAAISQHEVDPKQPKPFGKWHPEEWQNEVHESAWAAIKPRSWIWGTFIWAEHDFAVDGRNEGEHAGRNDKGLITYDGKTRKDAFYFYKSNWNPEPMVYITERRFSPRSVADAPIKIYSNCDTVELIKNGVSQGTMTGSDIHVFVWPNVQLDPGENKFSAKGKHEGKTIEDSCTIVFDLNATDGNAPATQPALKAKK